MIWARPLTAVDRATPWWKRSGLTSTEVGPLISQLQGAALLTGLTEDARDSLRVLPQLNCLHEGKDTAVIACSRASLEVWCLHLGASELGAALRRLLNSEAVPPPTPFKAMRLEWGQRVRIMGIVNVTPDSFSDGGQHADTAAAIAHGEALLKAEADILDVGGESTRPGAAPVSETEELHRVIPVIEGLCARHADILISIDTQKASVAKAAMKAGAQLINDVGGLRDDKMIEVVAQTGAVACVMHMLGDPQSMQREPRYEDVGAEILDALEGAVRRAEAYGIGRERLWVDPGIGFGKTAAHNLFLLRRLHDFRLLGAPVMLGVSRKAFLGSLVGGKPARERGLVSAVAAAVMAASRAVDVVRVHDVGETREALAVAEAIVCARDGGALFHS